MIERLFPHLGPALALFVLLPLPAAGQAADTVVLTLAEAERTALERSPLMGPARAAVELSMAQQKQAAGARYLPEFGLRNVWGPIPRARGEFNEFGVLNSPDTTGVGKLTWFTQVNVELVQPLYTFGKIDSRIDAAGHRVEVDRAGLEATRLDVLFRVRQAYWGAVLTGELLGLSRSVDERVTEAEDRLQELYDEGSASQNDMFKFRIFKYQVNSRTREVESERTKALEGLRALVGLASGTVVRVADDDLQATDVALEGLATYLAAAYENRPELQQLDAGIQARRALVRAAGADALPSFFLAGEFAFNHSPGRFDPENPFLSNSTNFTRAGLALGLDWDLDFWRKSDEDEVARLELRSLQAQASPLRAQVEREVREAYLDAVRARADVEDGEEALQASENLLRAELQTFDIGLANIEDVIDAFQSNVTMTVEQLENIATLNTKLAELSRRVGRDVGGVG